MIEQVQKTVREKASSGWRKDLPLLMCHGNGDAQVKWNWGDRSQGAIKELGFTHVDFRTYR